MKRAWTLVYRFVCLRLQKKLRYPLRQFPVLDM